MTLKYHNINDFIKVIRVMHRKSIKLEEITTRLDKNYEQIKNYPTPIAGCDEQFNFLLEELDRLRNLLATEGNGSVTVE